MAQELDRQILLIQDITKNQDDIISSKLNNLNNNEFYDKEDPKSAVSVDSMSDSEVSV
jgi:hypothetical protein